MERSITVIQARESRANFIEQTERRKRVVVYCKISTYQLEQLSSYKVEVSYYANYINIYVANEKLLG